MDYFKTMISIFLRGLLMGISDIMPGISGGTIALITGIYDRLIGSISKIKFMFLKPLFKGNFSNPSRNLKNSFSLKILVLY